MARANELDLVRGTLDVLVLKSVQDNPQHGYAVAAWIRRVTDDALTIEDGALYTALHRMEKRGWLASTWGVSENNRRAKYYRLTPKGRRQLDSQHESWSRYSEAVSKVLDATAPGGS
jgi:PadR family transcriptional regulator